MRIGFFDSGIGGLTVLAEALERAPGVDWLYYADTDGVPYGDKPREQVRDYVFQAAAFLAGQGAEALVVACNTATSLAIEDLRRIHPFPVIGMEPAVKPALALGDRRVLVLATERTLREAKLRRLVRRLDAQVRVDGLALPRLVTLAEAFDFAPETVGPYLAEATANLDLAAYGAVVLGCTHFPYFRPHLARLFPPGTPLVDGNRGTVNRLLARIGGAPAAAGPGSLACYESGRAVGPGRFRRFLDYYRAVLAAQRPA